MSKNVKNELKLAQKEAPDLSKYEAEFHYPSLLILLEEEAANRDLSIEIHHSNIKSTSHMITEEIEDIDGSILGLGKIKMALKPI